MILGLKTEISKKENSSKYFHTEAAALACEDADSSYQAPSLAAVGAEAQDISITDALLNLPVAFAGELGYKGHNSYVMHPCAVCGRERWTEIRKGRPRYTICLSCARITLHKKRRLVTQVHMCSPHYWLVDSRDVGRCKCCGQEKDFGELRKKKT